MPAYSGKFQYLDSGGASLNQGSCQVSFDEETCIVTPSGGDALAFDLGDVDCVAPAEWSIVLTLFTGNRIELRQFGAAFARMAGELLAAWRDRTVRCLLLEDLEEVGRYEGAVNGTNSQIRLYRSNLAILPLSGLPVQWRLAEIDSARFDDSTYALNLASGTRQLVISKLAKKTDEFRGRLGEMLDGIRTHTAEALHRTFPFLNPDQLQRLTKLMPEGRTVSLAAMAAIHPKLPEALVARAVDEPLKPYFEALRAKSVPNALMTGFKFIREDEEPAEDESGEPAGQPGDSQPPLFFWFFFPIAGKTVLAWEATTGSGRATYFFRSGETAEGTAERLTRGLALVNFRREPVYLPDDSLELQPKSRRYAIGARKLPDLRELRASFLRRAIHSSLEAWTEQVRGLCG